MKGTMAYDKIPRFVERFSLLEPKQILSEKMHLKLRLQGLQATLKSNYVYKIPDTKLILMSLLTDPLLYTIPLLSFIPQ